MIFEFLLEEESSEVALQNLVPKIIGTGHSLFWHTFQGKKDLLNSLPNRLRGYAQSLSAGMRIVVLLDCDNDDCRELKNRLETIATQAGLRTRTTAAGSAPFHVLNRIAVEELEAWFFGDATALSTAYAGVPKTLDRKQGYRVPDKIKGGTWEALERVLQKAGYFSSGIRKIELARQISAIMDPDRNRSHSFKVFRDGLRATVA
jgi:hypothetical protein